MYVCVYECIYVYMYVCIYAEVDMYVTLLCICTFKNPSQVATMFYTLNIVHLRMYVCTYIYVTYRKGLVASPSDICMQELRLPVQYLLAIASLALQEPADTRTKSLFRIISGRAMGSSTHLSICFYRLS